MGLLPSSGLGYGLFPMPLATVWVGPFTPFQVGAELSPERSLAQGYRGSIQSQSSDDGRPSYAA
jgi:hypothetical protein